MGHDTDISVEQRARQLAARLAEGANSFADARPLAEREYLDLLHAVRATHHRFAFDRDGRPDAVRAVREALPLMERELFDAVLEDHACEVAAIEEALYQFALVLGGVRK